MAAAALINVAAGTLFSWSVLLPQLTVEFHTTAQVLAGPFSTAVAVFAVSVVVAGRAVDRHGARRTSAAAGVLSGTGLVVTALAQHLVVLHVGFGLLFGAGSGLAYSSVVTWASTRTSGNPTRSVAVVVAAFAAGPVIAGPAGGPSSASWGWRVTLLAGAAVVSSVTVLASRVLPDAVVVAPLDAGPAARATHRSALAALWLVFLCASTPGLFAFAYGAELVAERGLDQRLGGLAVAAMGLGNLVGRLVAHPLVSLLGLRAALRVDLLLMCSALLALAAPARGAAAMVTLVLVALQYGAVSALLPTAVRRVSDASRFGSAYGWVFSAWGLAGVVAPRLRDPADAGAGSWVPLTVAAVVGLVVYERRAAQRPP